MNNEERLEEEVKLRCFDDKFVDKKEEREILQVAISIDIGIDQARTLLKKVCLAHEYILESEIDQQAIEMLTQFAGNDGKIDKKEFTDTVNIIKNSSKGVISDRDIGKKIKSIILDKGWNIKSGFFSGGDWFNKI
jgi:uncharacterized protein Yka (UPF0111/DUF47 family)